MFPSSLARGDFSTDLSPFVGRAHASKVSLRQRPRTYGVGQVRMFKAREIRGPNERSQSTADVDRNPPAATKTPKRSFDDSQHLAPLKPAERRVLNGPNWRSRPLCIDLN